MKPRLVPKLENAKGSQENEDVEEIRLLIAMMKRMIQQAERKLTKMEAQEGIECSEENSQSS